MWLLDSDILLVYSESDHPFHQRILEHGDRVGWENIALPVVVAGEALRGRLLFIDKAHQLKPAHLLKAYSSFRSSIHYLGHFPIVEFDEGALRHYSGKGVSTARCGRSDRLIAWIALAGDHVLVTRNVAHYASIQGLKIENWIDDPLP